MILNDIDRGLFTVETTRLHNKKFCRSGFVFLVVRCKDMLRKYTSALQVSSSANEIQKYEIAQNMFKGLKEKYNL